MVSRSSAAHRARSRVSPFEGGTCTSHSRRLPRPLLAPAGDTFRQPPALCGPSWADAVRPSPPLRAQAGFLATFRVCHNCLFCGFSIGRIP
jgi:hypothetical protein